MISREIIVYTDDADGPTIVTLDDKLMACVHCNDGVWCDYFDTIFEALGAIIEYADYSHLPEDVKQECLRNGRVELEDLTGEEE